MISFDILKEPVSLTGLMVSQVIIILLDLFLFFNIILKYKLTTRINVHNGTHFMRKSDPHNDLEKVLPRYLKS